MTEEPRNFKYDVFVSYNSRDSQWVYDSLLPRLKAAGMRVCIDEDFEVGLPIVTQLENAIRYSRFILAVLTPDYLTSRWAEFERALVEDMDPSARQSRVIPILLRTCEVPLRISNMAYADFTRSESIDSEFQKLLAATASREKRAAASSSPVPSRGKDYHLAAIRDLLVTAFSDEELTSLCYDSFPAVYDEFTAGMTKSWKTQRLIEYCERHGELGRLLATVKELNPFQYKRFESRLNAES